MKKYFINIIICFLAFSLGIIIQKQWVIISAFIIEYEQNYNSQLIGKSNLIELYVDNSLYFDNGNSYIIHFIIRNTSNKNIGVDLQHSGTVIFPFWYELGQEPVNSFNIAINGRVPHPLELNPIIVDNIINSYNNNKICIIKPGEYSDYYLKNYLDLDKYKKEEDKYLTFLLQGQLFVTDGKQVENIKADLNKTGIIEDIRVKRVKLTINYPLPIKPKNLPANVIMFVNSKPSFAH